MFLIIIKRPKQQKKTTRSHALNIEGNVVGGNVSQDSRNNLICYLGRGAGYTGVVARQHNLGTQLTIGQTTRTDVTAEVLPVVL